MSSIDLDHCLCLFYVFFNFPNMVKLAFCKKDIFITVSNYKTALRLIEGKTTPQINDKVFLSGKEDDSYSRGLIHKIVGDNVTVGWIIQGFRWVKNSDLTWKGDYWVSKTVGSTSLL